MLPYQRPSVARRPRSIDWRLACIATSTHIAAAASPSREPHHRRGSGVHGHRTGRARQRAGASGSTPGSPSSNVRTRSTPAGGRRRTAADAVDPDDRWSTPSQPQPDVYPKRSDEKRRPGPVQLTGLFGEVPYRICLLLVERPDAAATATFPHLAGGQIDDQASRTILSTIDDVIAGRQDLDQAKEQIWQQKDRVPPGGRVRIAWVHVLNELTRQLPEHQEKFTWVMTAILTCAIVGRVRRGAVALPGQRCRGLQRVCESVG